MYRVVLSWVIFLFFFGDGTAAGEPSTIHTGGGGGGPSGRGGESKVQEPAAATGGTEEIKRIDGVIPSGLPCRAPCLNNGSCVNGRCVCRPGYQGEFCAERKFMFYGKMKLIMPSDFFS